MVSSEIRDPGKELQTENTKQIDPLSEADNNSHALSKTKKIILLIMLASSQFLANANASVIKRFIKKTMRSNLLNIYIYVYCLKGNLCKN